MLKQFDYLFTDNILKKYENTNELTVLRIMLGLVTFINSKEIIGEYRKYTEGEILAVNKLMEFIYDLDVSLQHKSMEKLIFVNYKKPYQTITMKRYGQYVDITGNTEDVIEDSYIELLENIQVHSLEEIDEFLQVFDTYLNEIRKQKELFLLSLNKMKVLNEFVMIE